MSNAQSSSRKRIAIIGGGMSGIIMAIKLKQSGFENFIIYEREPEFGGTWFVNTYPGCAVDTHADVYRMSFLPYQWQRTHPTRQDILEYLRYAVAHFGLVDHFRFKTSMTHADWDDDLSGYNVHLDNGEVQFFDFIVSSVGSLSEPLYPEWDGLRDFEGPVVHSARWDPSLDWRGKKIGVVGTGSTSAQLVPSLAESAEHLFVFQRQPGWILPLDDGEDTPGAVGPVEDPAVIAQLEQRREAEMKKYADMFADGQISVVDSEVNKAWQAKAEEFIQESFIDRPDLIPLVTPDYPFMGKRPVLSNNFYPALKRDNVTLVPFAVDSVTPSGVIDDSGKDYSLDILILATGFHASNLVVRSIEVVGRHGVSLKTVWETGPRAYLGIAVPEFPNFFIMAGPNTALTGSMLPIFEGQADFIIETLADASSIGASQIEVKRSEYERFNNWLEESFIDSTYTTTKNYFTSSTGRIVYTWPRSVDCYLEMLKSGRDVFLLL